ncbi:ABC transporter permease [Chryseomicrobium excrementi]|uniref:ABC transporter permease n=1 Tax=Chryseomicrobium excrementi TaxID=2041346 RepID=A0A2M9F196_9BACL|nr:ABC transporter permease subunit [Chryseomicrobium excrementi]PJK17236.1 ABC transporter permease [Chryseomicrobium excrementi]
MRSLRVPYSVLILLCFLFVIPFIPALLASLGGVWRFPLVIPEGWSFRAWEAVFRENSGTLSAIWTSLWIALCVTVINVLVSVPAAYALVRGNLRYRAAIEAILLAPIFVPALAVVMGIHLTFLRLGLTETVLGVVLVHLAPSMPYVIRAAMISFETMNRETEQAAQLLGAGPWSRFLFVILPHLRAGLVAGVTLSMLISLSQYSVTLLIGGGQVVTLPILLFPYISGGDTSIGSAYTLVFSAVALLLVISLDVALRGHYKKKGRSRV